MRITTVDDIRRVTMFLLTAFFFVLAKAYIASVAAAGILSADILKYAFISFLLMSATLIGMTGKFRISVKLSAGLAAIAVIAGILSALL